MYWEARMRIHQPKHILVDFYFLRVIYNKPYLSWPALLACAEPYVYIFFFCDLFHP